LVIFCSSGTQWSLFPRKATDGHVIDHPGVLALHAMLDFHTFFDQGGGQSLGAKI
jgi:hypothetical protein